MSEASPRAEITLRIRRTIAAPREVVFRAWTDPDRLRRWWGVEEGYTTPIAEVDLRVGGRYRLGMKPPDTDEVHVVGGAYRVVQPPEKLVFTWAWEGPPSEHVSHHGADAPPMADPRETLVTVEFFDREGFTEVVLTHEYFPDQATRDQHQHGWNGVLAQLARLVQGGQA